MQIRDIGMVHEAGRAALEAKAVRAGRISAGELVRRAVA